MWQRLAVVAWFGAVAATLLILAPGWWRLLVLVPAFGIWGVMAATRMPPPAAPSAPESAEQPAPRVAGGPGGPQGRWGPAFGNVRDSSLLPPGLRLQRADAVQLRALNDAVGHQDWGDYPNPHYDEDDCCCCPDHWAIRRARREDDYQ